MARASSMRNVQLFNPSGRASMTGGNHLAMKSMVQLFNEWEIQLLVLVSFTIQFFLFFAGGLRRRIRSRTLRSLIWLAYLGADLVAAFVLGLISRQEVSTRHLSFFWAPFLLIHLGGQDTITAFAIEDNTLWRRHLLNLVVQVSLTIYIFWKSFDGGPNMQLLAPTIFLFVTGTIKYVERTWALWHRSLTNIRDSSVFRTLSMRIETCSDPFICAVLSANIAYCFFTGIVPPLEFNDWDIVSLHPDLSTNLFWIMEIQLSLMFDDIYTKALVLQVRVGIILRFISHLSFVAAFVLFLSVVRNKNETWYYNSVDTGITYGLFVGGLSLEVSSWIWARKEKIRDCIFLGSIRCPRKRGELWSNSMGQYNMLNYFGQSDRQSSKMMAVIRKLANVFRWTGKQKLWISKLVDTKFVEVDDQIMRCVVQRIAEYRQEGEPSAPQPQQWPTLGPLLQKIVRLRSSMFDYNSIIMLHLFTEVQLSSYVHTGTAVDRKWSYELVRVCRMISQYMIYLLVTYPDMLPIHSGSQGVLAQVADHCKEDLQGANADDILRQARQLLTEKHIQVPEEACTEVQLLELQEAWVGVLLHAASKSRPEMHAAVLAEGGELLTFIWLLMAHYGLGDVQGCPIEMTDSPEAISQRHYAFRLAPQREASGTVHVHTEDINYVWNRQTRIQLPSLWNHI